MDMSRKTGSSNLAQHIIAACHIEYRACLTPLDSHPATHNDDPDRVEAQHQERHQEQGLGKLDGRVQDLIIETSVDDFRLAISPTSKTISEISDGTYIHPNGTCPTNEDEAARLTLDLGNMPSFVVDSSHALLRLEAAASSSHLSLDQLAAVQQQSERRYVHSRLWVMNTNRASIIEDGAITPGTRYAQTLGNMHVEQEQLRLDDSEREKENYCISEHILMHSSKTRVLQAWCLELKTDIMNAMPSGDLVQFFKKKGAKMVAPHLKKLAEEVEKIADEDETKLV